MNKISLWIEKFLNRFTYEGKTRFVCFLGFLYAIFLISDMYFTQRQLVEMYAMKIIGIKHHRDLSEILEYTSNLEILISSSEKGSKENEKEIEDLIAKIDHKLKEILTFMQKNILDTSILDSEKIRDSNLFLDKAIKQWESIGIAKKNKKNLPIIFFSEFSNNILELMNENMDSHYLAVGVELSIVILTDVAILRVPFIQNVITNLAILPYQISTGMIKEEVQFNFIELETSLQNRMKVLQSQIDFMIRENQSRYENQLNAVVDLFKQYEINVSKYLSNLDSDKDAFLNPQYIGNNVLQEGWRLENFLNDFLEKYMKEASNTLHQRQQISLAILLIGLVAFLIMYVTRVMRKPLDELKQAVTELVGGDLTVRVPVTSKDEVAKIIIAFNEMTQVWEDSLLKAKNITLKLVDASVSIFDIVKNLESNVISQEVSVDSMKVQAKEIGMTIQKFNDVLKEVNKSIIVTSSLAETGRSNLEEMEAITLQMREASRLIVDTLSLIGAQVEKINRVLVAVVSIADQSNLLSLNTAIRASQTGVKGVGFTVVAGKIRELADRTAFATLDIEQTVQDIVNSISAAVADVERFSSQILDQVGEEKNINDQFKLRIDQTQEQIKAFDRIQENMDRQSKESLQIASLINDLVQVTMETGKSARKLKQDADFLSRGTKDLQEIIDRFHFRQ